MSATIPVNDSVENETQIINSSYHPSYCNEDASLVIISDDGISFRVHPLILRIGSEIFRNMLDEAKDTEEPVRLVENSGIIKAVLDLIYPNGVGLRLFGQNFDFIWSLLNAADKYEISKIKEEFRARLLTDTYFLNHRLEAYAIACRCSWKEEISAISIHCLEYINTSESWKLLSLLEAKHALGLHNLISVRKEKFLEGWRDFTFDSENVNVYRSVYTSTEYELGIYRDKAMLLALLEQELVKHPSGESLKSEFWDRAELFYFFDRKDKLKMKALEILPTLPSTIDDSFL